jgi:hypothetical protein
MNSFSKRLLLAYFLVAFLSLSGKEPLPGQLKIVEDGKCYAKIVIPENSSKNLVESANLLADYIFKSSNMKLPVSKGMKSEVPGGISINAGGAEFAKKFNIDIKNLDKEGFIIAFPDAANIVITANSDTGIEYGIYEFLERYIGVRWLFPGESGEYIPKHNIISIPTETVKIEPKFLSRCLSVGWKTKENEPLFIWAKRMRMSNRIAFHHNLCNLFPPDKYKITHPEFFPIIQGKRYLPKDGEGKNIFWQPCFSADGVVDEAVKNICKYFSQYPDVDSYSLGVNDGGGHCECDKCKAKDGNEKNYLGARNCSQSYFEWCNKVIQKVRAKYPQKYFGLLAYGCVVDPPKNLKFDNHLIPHMTYDRMQWISPDREKAGHLITEKWAAIFPALGWYDYIYGDFYVLPRIYFHKMAEYLRWGYSHNVRYYYAEAYTSADWHEGPKYYLTLKLAWNPDLDVDNVLNDWYKSAVGEKAAPFLAEYFTLLEKFWIEKAPKSKWYKADGGKRQFLDFGSTGYLDELDLSDLKHAEKLLNKVCDLAENKTRAEFIRNSFLKREKMIEAYCLNRELNNGKFSPDKSSEILKCEFDSENTLWTTWQNVTSTGKFNWDSSVGRNNNGSLAILGNNNDATMCFLKSIPTDSDKIYKVSVWCKTKNIPGNAEVSLSVKWQDGVWPNAKWMNECYTVAKEINNINAADWQNLTLYCKPPEKEKCFMTCMFIVKNADKGTVWFDDFSLSEVMKAKGE